MTEKELYSQLIRISKDKTQWKDKLTFTASLLESNSTSIIAKALWLCGEMGLMYPQMIKPYIEKISVYLKSDTDLLRERAVNALGRIGRADYQLVKPYYDNIMTMKDDKAYGVRLSFIWACENIAMSSPEAFKDTVPSFEKLLSDENVRVRIEAPEIFRVLAKRKPQYVRPYIEELTDISLHDADRTVKIHCKGAIKAITLNN